MHGKLRPNVQCVVQLLLGLTDNLRYRKSFFELFLPDYFNWKTMARNGIHTKKFREGMACKYYAIIKIWKTLDLWKIC